MVRTIQAGEGQVEYTPIGHSTSLAARLQTLANPGSIAISEAMRKLVEGYFTIGLARIKGSTDRVEVYEVTGLGPLRTRLQRSAGRGLTKFVGREREMEASGMQRKKHAKGTVKLSPWWQSQDLEIATLLRIQGDMYFGWKVLEAFSVSHGKGSAYLPLIDLLRSFFKIANEDDGRPRREKIAGRIAILDRNLEETLPYLFILLGIVKGDEPLAQMDGQIKKRRTLEAVKRISCAGASISP